MKLLCKVLGGSNLYRLNNSSSDEDIREVFNNTELSKILGLERFDSQVIQNKEDDVVRFEIRHFLGLCQKTNTQVLELLFAPKHSFVYLDNQFEALVVRNRDMLIDTKKLFSTLCGYMRGERKRTNGASTGKLGSKRMVSIDKYGFSEKNLCNFIRLALTGTVFFETGRYVVDCREFGDKYYALLKGIRENPSSFSKEDANYFMDQKEGELKEAFNKRDESNDKRFDFKLANDILMEIYRPFLSLI